MFYMQILINAITIISIFLLIFSLIKFKLESNKNILFINGRFYFYIIDLLTVIIFNFLSTGLFSSIIFIISSIYFAFDDMLFLSIYSDKITGLFFKYNYNEIHEITITNYPDKYTNRILITIVLKNSKYKKFRISYNENLLNTLDNSNFPVINTFKKIKEL